MSVEVGLKPNWGFRGTLPERNSQKVSTSESVIARQTIAVIAPWQLWTSHDHHIFPQSSVEEVIDARSQATRATRSAFRSRHAHIKGRLARTSFQSFSWASWRQGWLLFLSYSPCQHIGARSRQTTWASHISQPNMSTNPLDKVPSPDAATTWSQSQSSNEYQRTMGPISPPYAPRPLDGSPPGYQSRQNVGLPNSSAHHATEGGPLPPFDASQAYNSAAASHHAAEGGPLPPFDASQAYNSAAAEAAAGAEEKRGIMGHPSADSSSHPAFRAPQAPRIAVTDPLADMRLHNLSKPVGLGAKSDWPSRERPMASAQAYPPGSNLSGENTPRIDGLPINSNTGLPIRPTLTRQDSEVSTEHGYEDFEDGFNWSDDEAVEEAARFEEEVAQQRKLKIGRLSLYSVLRFLAVTFIGNLIVSCLLIIPVVVIQFVYRPAPYASHRDFVADNVQAWFIWAAFNLHVMWWLHFFVGLVPRVGVSLVQIIWGTANQDVKSIAEFYGAIRQYISPITYAAMAWGSWAILFNSIYGLYSHTDPSTTSRARYLYRIYQVVEFFVSCIC